MHVYRAVTGLQEWMHYRISSAEGEVHSEHCHEQYEVYYVVRGDVHCTVGGRMHQMRPGSMLLIPPGMQHCVRVESREPYERYVLLFPKESISAERISLLLAPFGESDPTLETFYENAEHFHLRACLDEIMDCRMLEESLRMAILPIRIENLLARVVAASRATKGMAASEDGRQVKQILDFIHRHLSEPLTLDGLAERFFLNKHSLNRLFKRVTGTTVMDYIIHKRIALARSLIENGYPLTGIAEYVGFQDYSSFFRAYKKASGQSPSQTRAGSTGAR